MPASRPSIAALRDFAPRRIARLREDGVIASHRGSCARRPEEDVPAPFVPISRVAHIKRCFGLRLTIESRGAGLAACGRSAAPRTGTPGSEAGFPVHDAVAAANGNRFFLETLHMPRLHIDTRMRMLPRLAQRRIFQGESGDDPR